LAGIKGNASQFPSYDDEVSVVVLKHNVSFKMAAQSGGCREHEWLGHDANAASTEDGIL